MPAGASESLRQALRQFRRQALHAYQLGFEHPTTHEYQEWTAQLPEDMETLLHMLQDDQRHTR